MSERILRYKTCPACNTEFQCPPKIGLRNWNKRKFCSRVCKAKNAPRGKEAGAWKDRVGYAGVHRWVYREFGLPKVCSHCHTTNAPKFEWANISGEYRRDSADWVRLCTSCHRRFDASWARRTRDALGRFA